MIKMTPELFNKFAEKQEELDSMIREKHGISIDEWHYGLNMNHRIALQVEIAEFANECHDAWKYWKQKEVTPDRIIDEAVDVIHFLHLMINKSSREYPLTIVEQISRINSEIERWTYCETRFLIDKFVQCHALLDLTYAILLVILDRYNFTLDDIEEAYDRKNAINHDRQHHDY